MVRKNVASICCVAPKILAARDRTHRSPCGRGRPCGGARLHLVARGVLATANGGRCDRLSMVCLVRPIGRACASLPEPVASTEHWVWGRFAEMGGVTMR